jgi:molecular chaperone GrpE
MSEQQSSAVESDPNAQTPTDTEPDAQLLRVLADLDNLRKRYERQLASEAAAERARVVSMWLPVVDDLERALQHVDGSSDTVAEGVRAVRDHALAVLKRLGFARFDDLGRRFDPTRDEAVASVDVDAPAGRIVDVVSPGYLDGDDVLRPARVVVARAPSASAEPAPR